MGETGVFPVGSELVAASLMMPTTSNRVSGNPFNVIMHDTQRNDSDAKPSDMSHGERVRSQINTTDLNSIMGRFYDAVSWRSEE